MFVIFYYIVFNKNDIHSFNDCLENPNNEVWEKSHNLLNENLMKDYYQNNVVEYDQTKAWKNWDIEGISKPFKIQNFGGSSDQNYLNVQKSQLENDRIERAYNSMENEVLIKPTSEGNESLENQSEKKETGNLLNRINPLVLSKDPFKLQDPSKSSEFLVYSEKLQKSEENSNKEDWGKRRSERRRLKNSPNYEELNLEDGKFKRWKKSDDKRLFQVIRELEAKQVFNLNEVLLMKSDEEVIQHQGIKILAAELDWKSVRKALVRRIQTLCKGKLERIMMFKFSCRDIKQLKRELK